VVEQKYFAAILLASGNRRRSLGVQTVSLGTILVVILVLVLIGALPTWSHSANWGYVPSGGASVLLLVVVILLVTGRI